MRSTLATREAVPGVIVLGRCFLAAVPVLWIASYLARPLWADVSHDGDLSDHPVATVIIVLALVVAMGSPWLLLPWGPVRDATLDPEGLLTLVTVLGRRRVDLTNVVKVGTLTMVGQRKDEHLLYLRCQGGRWAIASLGDEREVPADLLSYIVAAAEEDPEVLSTRARRALRLGEMPSRGQVLARAAMTIVLLPVAWCAAAFVVWMLILAGCFPTLFIS